MDSGPNASDSKIRDTAADFKKKEKINIRIPFLKIILDNVFFLLFHIASY